ncbi:hypothetical protein HDU96_008824 [Phlyctochytrium bullatum]|nr:hypothetical protein HDU96_008824 [Phlyctochytrium bullatum]
MATPSTTKRETDTPAAMAATGRGGAPAIGTEVSDGVISPNLDDVETALVVNVIVMKENVDGRQDVSLKTWFPAAPFGESCGASVIASTFVVVVIVDADVEVLTTSVVVSLE